MTVNSSKSGCAFLWGKYICDETILLYMLNVQRALYARTYEAFKIEVFSLLS